MAADGATPYEQSVVLTASLLQARSRWLDDEGVTDQRPALAWTTGDPPDTYERGRLGYPLEAVRWGLAGASRPVRRVLDVGAGTGKLTRTLADLDLDVVAVDPSALMLNGLAVALPEVERRVGTAEELPLEDASVDAVTCGQAWPWVDAARGAAEVARVLRPGGVLALMWNLRDESEPWVVAFSAVWDVQKSAGQKLHEQPPELGPLLTAPERHEVRHRQSISPADLRDMSLSRWHVLQRDPADRERVLARVHELAETPPDLGGREAVDLPYLTVTWRSRRRT